MKLCTCSLLLVLFAVGYGCAHSPTTTAGAPLAATQPKMDFDWAQLSRYRDANVKLGPPASSDRRVVFFGDSLTENWGMADPMFFAQNGYVNRGISGQTTSQMLVRFRQDVIALKPTVVVLLAGTNDIAQNGGLITLEGIEDNLHSMVDLAQSNGIRVVLSSVLPTIDYPWRPGLQPAGKISALNRWIQEFCAQGRLEYIDYHSTMANADGSMRPGLSADGVHPNRAGYAIMEPIAKKAIWEALQ